MRKTIYTTEREALVELLKECRLEAGHTQESLADALETTQSIVSKVERGERGVDVVELWWWCSALGINFTTFTKRLADRLKSRRRR